MKINRNAEYIILNLKKNLHTHAFLSQIFKYNLAVFLIISKITSSFYNISVFSVVRPFRIRVDVLSV